mmetsp:Transcript_14996/g.24825  ORF Transcript_14996/g.24825 Transcript_14996/m.24825 type:complete len:1019 (-) Transcript_14996:236-3292(-)
MIDSFLTCYSDRNKEIKVDNIAYLNLTIYIVSVSPFPVSTLYTAQPSIAQPSLNPIMSESSVYIVSPEFSGYLLKKGFYWRKLWKRKWVVLHGDEISYMDEKPTKETAKTIQITKARISIKSVIDTEDLEDDPNGFAILINDDENGSDASPPWYLRGESLDDKKLWLNKLCRTHAITHWLHQYEKIKVLGIGGSAVVHELKHKRTGKRYAMKEMEIKHKGMMDMAVAEAQMLMNIMERVDNHPNIMEINKVFQVGDKFYLVFPLCTGGELYDAVIKRGHFTEFDAAMLFRDLISALKELHSHDILHLDIKPENILFESDEPDARIKLTDFGLAKAFHTDEETGVSTGDRVPTLEELNDKLEQFVSSGILQSHMRGTMGYMSPELILCGASSKPADIWASGVVLFILLSGKPPFQSRSHRDILEKSAKGKYSLEGDEWESVSADAKDLINKMLAFDPAQRITAAEVLEHPWIKMVSAPEDSAVEEDTGAQRARRLTSSTPLSGALKNLTGHVKDRRMEKMATNLTKLMTSLQVGSKGKATQGATQTLYQRLTAGLEGGEKEESEKEATVGAEAAIQSMMSNDMKDSIVGMFQSMGAGDDGKISVEQFCQIFQGMANNEGGGNPLMMVLIIRFLDADKDGYITVEDLFLAEAKILQRSSDFVKIIFRAYSEALWYPGQKMNHMQMARSMGVVGGDVSPRERHDSGEQHGTDILGSSDSSSSKADVFEPPKYITSKHVAAVFQKLGYNPDVGVEIFNGLCTSLAEHRLALAKARQSRPSGTSVDENENEDDGADERDERDVAEILAERKSTDDEVPALITHFPLANALARTVTSTYNAATRVADEALDDYLLTKMDVLDFVAASEIDDVLIQAVQLKPRKCMMDYVARSSESRKLSGESSPARGKFIYKEGWLQKQGSKIKTWKKRWFVLHRPASPGASFLLKYYTAQDKATEKGFFKIPGGSSVKSLEDDHRGEKKKHQNYFELQAEGNNGKTTLLLSADSAEEKAAWVDAIQSCIDTMY